MSTSFFSKCSFFTKRNQKWSEVAQSCPTLCDPMDYSPPGSSIHGIILGKNTGVVCHFLFQGIFSTHTLALWKVFLNKLVCPVQYNLTYLFLIISVSVYLIYQRKEIKGRRKKNNNEIYIILYVCIILEDWNKTQKKPFNPLLSPKYSLKLIFLMSLCYNFWNRDWVLTFSFSRS